MCVELKHILKKIPMKFSILHESFILITIVPNKMQTECLVLLLRKQKVDE